jgi:hypothetical protein
MPPERILAALAALHRRRTQHLGRALGAAAGGTAALGLTLALAAAQAGAMRLAVSLLALGATAASALGCAWAVTILTRRRPPRHAALRRMAALAAQLVPDLACSLRSAIALAPELAGLAGRRDAAPLSERVTNGSVPACSAALAAQHVRSTAQALQASALPERWWAAAQTRLRATYGSCATAGLLAAIGLVACDAGRQRLYRMFRGNTVRINAVPLAADLQLHYVYPSYTQLAPRHVDSSDGSIEALAGTEVTVDVRLAEPAKRSWLQLTPGSTDATAEAKLTSTAALAPLHEQGQQVQFRLSVLQDMQYRLMVERQGERLADPQLHTVHALPDAVPKATLVQPASDVQLRDETHVPVRWRAEDDMGLQAVALVVERAETPELRIPLWTYRPDVPPEHSAEGTYSWATASLQLAPGTEATFYIEATDNDGHSGPKTGRSTARRLSVFSAEAHHASALDKVRAALDALTDGLAFELETPMRRDAAVNRSASDLAQAAVQQVAATLLVVREAEMALAGDKLAASELRTALGHAAAEVDTAHAQRQQRAIQMRAGGSAQHDTQLQQLAGLQARYIGQLERSIVYLDDLLAVQRIDSLQAQAKGLLADQRALQGLLARYRDSHDPAAKAQLQAGITALRTRMLDVLRKMGDIKKSLPGAYRNLEASSMLQLDAQLGRLDQKLQANDMAAAATELEQLANMVENMAQSLHDAKEQFGGERYAEMRAQMQDFAQKFEALQAQQETLSSRSEDLLQRFRSQAIAKSARNAEDFVHKARQLAQGSLHAIDRIAQEPELAAHLDRELEQAQRSLLDMDALLAHQQLAEAHALAPQAQDDAELLVERLAQPSRAQQASRKAAAQASALNRMLAQLFEDTNDVLSPAQQQQMAQMGRQQAQLAGQAEALAQRMEQMDATMPLFDAEAKRSLSQAQAQMQAASQELAGRALAEGAGHSRQANEGLAQLRQALSQAARRGGGQGIPLPLSAGGRPGSGHGAPRESGEQEEVAIPPMDRAKAQPSFRQNLLEAAQQQASPYYEDAVRRYYNELIR